MRLEAKHFIDFPLEIRYFQQNKDVRESVWGWNQLVAIQILSTRSNEFPNLTSPQGHFSRYKPCS